MMPNKTPRQSFVIEILIQKCVRMEVSGSSSFHRKMRRICMLSPECSVTVLHDPVVSCRRARCPSHGKKKKRKTWRGVASGHWNREVFFFCSPDEKKERTDSFLRTMVVVEKTDDSALCGTTLVVAATAPLSLSLKWVDRLDRPSTPHTPVCDYSSSALSPTLLSCCCSDYLVCVTLKTCTTSHHTNRTLSTDNTRTNVDRRC